MLRALLLGSCLFTAINISACGSSDDEPDGNGGKTSGGSAGEAGGRTDGGSAGTAGENSGGSAGQGDGGAPVQTGGGSSGGSPPEAGGAGGDGSVAGGSGAGGDGSVAGGSGGGSGGSVAGGSGGSGGSDGAETAGAGGEAGSECVPTSPAAEVCDGIDNDCNGDVDDIDVGKDGIRDCLQIMLIGAPGTYASSNFQQWLSEQGATVSRIHEQSAPASLTPANLHGYGVVILDHLTREYTVEESKLLGAWVRDGGGLMSLNGHSGSTDLARGNSLLVDLGVQHLAGARSGIVSTFSVHPLTTGLTSVTFAGGYNLGDLPNAEGSTVVAQLSCGPVGLALERGQGRAFVWGDEWVEFDSEWQSLPQIKTFWINALSWLNKNR